MLSAYLPFPGSFSVLRLQHLILAPPTGHLCSRSSTRCGARSHRLTRHGFGGPGTRWTQPRPPGVFLCCQAGQGV